MYDGMSASENPVTTDEQRLTLGGGARPWFQSMLRGWRGCCPRCNQHSLFTSYVKMASSCSHCGLDFEPLRADDAPAYFTILVVGHIVVPAMLMVEQYWTPALWVLVLIWPPLTLVLSLLLLPRIKGAVIALQWALNMRPGSVDPI